MCGTDECLQRSLKKSSFRERQINVDVPACKDQTSCSFRLHARWPQSPILSAGDSCKECLRREKVGGDLKGKSRARCYEVVVGSGQEIVKQSRKERKKRGLQVVFLLRLQQDLRGFFT